MDARMLFDEVLAADTEAEVTGVLERFNLADYTDEHWVPYGGWDNANNCGTIDNQQADPRAALGDKIINAVDAMLTRRCQEQGIDPSSSEAPKTMQEAAEKFFGVPEGRLARLTSQKRAALAQNIVVAVCGQKRPDYPCILIADKGEGQAPGDFGDTFLSLHANNKINIYFVQGKFNQGGAGVLPYCGKKHKYQLIVSRRHPTIKGDEPWGFTLVRRRRPVEGEDKNFRYEYLVSKSGRVFTLPPGPLPIWPSREEQEPMEGGTLIKLYEYRIAERTMAQTDLYYALSRQLFRGVLPFRIVELRDYESHALQATFAGMDVRIEEDRGDLLETRFSGEMGIKGVGSVSVNVALFKSSVTRDQMARYVHPKEALLLTLNGQTHKAMGRHFFERKSVKLKGLSRHLLVEVNCTRLPREVTAEMFMPSRDRIRECEEGEKLERRLEHFLRHNDELRQANERRRREKLRESSEKETIELFKSVIRDDPDLANVLHGKGELIDPTTRGETQGKFEGRRYPTYLRLSQKLPRPFVKDCPKNSKCRVVLETDAENEYLSRAHDSGELVVELDGFDYSASLNNGNVTLTFWPDDAAGIGQVYQVRVRLSTPEALTGWLEEQFSLRIAAAAEKDEDNKRGPSRRPRSRQIALPKIEPVTKEQWNENGREWTGEDVVEVDTDGEPAISYVNVDNTYLRRYQYGNAEEAELLRQQFMIGATVIGLILDTAIDNGNGAFDSEHAQVASQQIGKVLLPVINSLGKAELENFG